MAEFYSGRSILITGASGFLGKVLVEKLLRSVPDLAKLYLLIRPQNGLDAKQRLENMLKSNVSVHILGPLAGGEGQNINR